MADVFKIDLLDRNQSVIASDHFVGSYNQAIEYSEDRLFSNRKCRQVNIWERGELCASLEPLPTA